MAKTTTDPNPKDNPPGDETLETPTPEDQTPEGDTTDDGGGEGEEEEEELTPEKMQEKISQMEEELTNTRRALKKANREAARRRLALKEKSKEGGEGEDDAAASVLKTENERLKQELAQQKREAFLEKQRKRVHDAAAGLNFKHPEDALVLGGIDLGEDEEDVLTDDEIKASLRILARRRPELVAQKEIIDADSQRRGKADSLPIDEEDIARRFGIRNFVPTKKE